MIFNGQTLPLALVALFALAPLAGFADDAARLAELRAFRGRIAALEKGIQETRSNVDVEMSFRGPIYELHGSWKHACRGVSDLNRGAEAYDRAYNQLSPEGQAALGGMTPHAVWQRVDAIANHCLRPYMSIFGPSKNTHEFVSQALELESVEKAVSGAIVALESQDGQTRQPGSTATR